MFTIITQSTGAGGQTLHLLQWQAFDFVLYWFKLVLHPGSVKLNCAGNSCDGQIKARGQALIEGELDFL